MQLPSCHDIMMVQLMYSKSTHMLVLKLSTVSHGPHQRISFALSKLNLLIRTVWYSWKSRISKWLDFKLKVVVVLPRSRKVLFFCIMFKMCLYTAPITVVNICEEIWEISNYKTCNLSLIYWYFYWSLEDPILSLIHPLTADDNKTSVYSFFVYP